jgi:glycosyltransferase involved in cell wall biosynthesis
MKFSLVMATINRDYELGVFIQSLLLQSYKNFELIIVDQNSDNRVFDIVHEYKEKINIKYIRSAKKGISLNRNIGLVNCTGSIIAFPDDDCEYDADTLAQVKYFFDNKLSYQFFSCNMKSKQNNSLSFGQKNDTDITLKNFMLTTISITIFVRSTSIAAFKFDERLGAGAKYGSGEESDLILHLLKNGSKGFYHANIFVFHPSTASRTLASIYSYGTGYGALFKKAVVHYHFYWLFFNFFILIVKETIKSWFYPFDRERLPSLKGRLFGFFHYPN